MDKTIAVKEMARLLYQSGDLTNEFFSNRKDTDGKDAHTYLQKQYNEDSEKEYYIKKEIKLGSDTFIVHGFIDGVLQEDGETIIEEIKSTQTPLKDITLDFHREYLAQLMLYSYLYADTSNLDTLHIRLTYIHVPDYETRKFDLIKDFHELESFFFDSLEKYSSWLHLVEYNETSVLETLKSVEFPFKEKRKGQFELMRACYYTLSNNQILYTLAPTGIGKTMACLFSSLKTLNTKKDKLFYLTAKTLTQDVVIDSLKLLASKGLKLKSIVLTSKAKACFTKERICKPEKCKFAKGYFNRLRTAIEDIYLNNDLFDYDLIKEYANKYEICPFEFSLDLSEFADLIICDYNYVFDPKAHLIRYFEDSVYKSKVLVDEAHNLVDRSKEMYSSAFKNTDINKLVDILMQFDKSLFKKRDILTNKLKEYDEIMSENLYYYSHYLDDEILNLLNSIYIKAFNIFEEKKEFKERDDALEAFFNLKDFLDTAEYFSSNHMFIIKKENNIYHLEIKCFDASSYILDTVKKETDGIVFFSATLNPINYYMDLITHGEGKYLSLDSPFDPSKLKVIVNDSISTKFKDREYTILDIVKDIKTLVSIKKGNYIVFFSSYQYLELCLPHLTDLETNLVVQTKDLTIEERNNILSEFCDSSRAHLGLFVLGGSFSEGIDYVGDALNGVIIVGVGLPQVNIENELAKEFFEEKYGTGFDYAYTYPGFAKIVQAAGRVIRTDKDYGTVILIDKRFKYKKYKELYPAHWTNIEYISQKQELETTLVDFWNENV